jgi:hypothetical protein
MMMMLIIITTTSKEFFTLERQISICAITLFRTDITFHCIFPERGNAPIEGRRPRTLNPRPQRCPQTMHVSHRTLDLRNPKTEPTSSKMSTSADLRKTDSYWNTKKKETCNFNYSCQARHDKWKFSVLTMEVTATFERRKNILPGHVRWARSCSGRWRSSCRRPTISPRLGPPIQQATIKNRMVKSRMSKSRKRSKVECPKSRMSKSRTFKFRTNVWRESVAVNKNSNCVQRNWFLRSISDL